MGGSRGGRAEGAGGGGEEGEGVGRGRGVGAEITATRLAIKRGGETAAEVVALQQEMESSQAVIKRQEQEAKKQAEKVEAAQQASREGCLQCTKCGLVSWISGTSEIQDQKLRISDSHTGKLDWPGLRAVMNVMKSTSCATGP